MSSAIPLLTARGGLCSQQAVRRGYRPLYPPSKSRSACSICKSESSFARLRRFNHDTVAAANHRVAMQPSGMLICRLRSPALSSSKFPLTGYIVQKRAFSSGRPPTGGNKDEDSKEDTATKSSPLKKSKLLSRLPIPVHENIYTIPNLLTFSRLAVAPLIGYFIVNQNPALALSLFIYASATDLVDGWIARMLNQQTVVGSVVDPMADKTLMTVGVVCLAMNASIPVWLAGLILSRDVGLALAAIYYRWISLPPPKTMARYWDFSLPSAEVKPTFVSKANTTLQLCLLGTAMTMPVVPDAVLTAWNIHEAMTGLQYLVALTTVWSGMSYIYSKDAVKILDHAEIETRAAKKNKPAANGKHAKEQK